MNTLASPVSDFWKGKRGKEEVEKLKFNFKNFEFLFSDICIDRCFRIAPHRSTAQKESEGQKWKSGGKKLEFWS